MTQNVQKISRYEVVAELGRGAMGVVYKAKDPNIERIIALKTMRIDVHGTDQEEILRRFKHEAKLAGVMAHPNIVTIYDAGEFEGVFFMALEFIEGKTLQEILHEEKILPLERVMHIARHVCTGLDYAHQRGVIHRDIKPANVMVGNDNVVKIMDFGIAKSGATMTNAGQVLGTPTYMSPEQVRGRNLDGRSDLFSFGCCLYEMLTGEKPFAGQNVTTIIYKIINESPAPVHQLDPKIPPKLSEVISKCLEKDPELRYQNGAEIIEDLEALQAKSKSNDRTLPMGSVGRAALATADGTAAAPKRQRQSAAEVPGLKKPTPAPAAAKVHASTVAVAPKTAKVTAPNRYKLWMVVIPAVLVIGAAAMYLSSGNAASQSAPSVAPVVANPVPMEPTPKQKAKQKTAKAPQTASANVATAPATGDLQVSSTPSGVRVFISGITQNEWVTPFTAKELDPGIYEVKFSKGGYNQKTEEVTIETGKTASLNVSLLEQGATIAINSAPSGAAVWLNGKGTGKTTPVTLSVDQGSHRIELRKQGFENETSTLNVKDGERANYSPTLEAVATATDQPKKGGLFGKIFGGGKIPEGKGLAVVRAKPNGVLVSVNGKQHQTPSPFRLALDPGRYKFTYKLNGYKSQSREVVIEKGKLTESEPELEPAR